MDFVIFTAAAADVVVDAGVAMATHVVEAWTKNFERISDLERRRPQTFHFRFHIRGLHPFLFYTPFELGVVH